MQKPIKSTVLAVCSVFFLQAAAAKELTDADREALLENLEKLKATYESKSDGRFGSAAAVFQSAMGSEEAAVALYLKCVEKVDFTDQKKKGSEFRDWKKNQGAKLTSPGFSIALRHQLRWLTLTLQSAASKVDSAKIAADAQDAVDSLSEDFKRSAKLSAHQDVLNMPVTSSVFARAYELGQLKVENWPLVPTDLPNIYGQIILPRYRKPAGLALLKAGWTKYIQQVVSKQIGGTAADRGEREVVKTAAVMEAKAAEQQKFMSQTVPSLQWQMEADLFRSGDPDGAIVRMMTHLQKHTTHPSWPDWAKEFTSLLKPEVSPTTADPAPAPETTDE